MSADQDLIVGPEWDDENVGWFYDIPASKADGKDSWTLVAMEAPGGSSKYILSLWVGGREGPVGDDIEALSDPLNITDSKDLEKFEKSAIDHFEDKRHMGWLDLVLEYVRRNHERAKTKRRKQEVRERTKAADRHIPGTTGISYYVEAEGGLAVVERDEYQSLANFSARITEVVEVDTGSGDPPQRVFTIQARHAGNDYTFQVPATEFDSVRWVRQHLDSRAIYNPSVGKVKEHIKTAILSDSAEQVRSKAYRHLGWR